MAHLNSPIMGLYGFFATVDFLLALKDERYQRRTWIILSSGVFLMEMSVKMSGWAKKSAYISRRERLSKIKVGSTILVRSIPVFKDGNLSQFFELNTKGVQILKGCGSKSVYLQRTVSNWSYTDLFSHPLCYTVFQKGSSMW